MDLCLANLGVAGSTPTQWSLVLPRLAGGFAACCIVTWPGFRSGLYFEYEVEFLRFTAADVYHLRLFAELLVPCRDRVFSRRQIGQGKRAVLVADRIVRILQDHEHPAHPGVQFAFHADNLRFVVLDDHRW